MRTKLLSALLMLKTPRRSALFALIFASIGCFCAVSAGAAAEPLYYIYQGQQKALTLDAQHVAVRVNAPTTTSRSAAAALPASLASRGFTSVDAEAQPVPGWMILNAQNALPAQSAGQQLTQRGSGQADPSAIHTLVASLLTDPSIEFVSPVFRDARGGPIVVTSRILVGFKQDLSGTERERLRMVVPEGASVEDMEFPHPHDQRWQIKSRDGFAVLARANALAQTPGVAYAEPDMIITGYTSLVPSDPSFSHSWGLRNTGQASGTVGFDMGATSAWEVTLGSASVIVLVMDSGVQQNHPDINQITGRDFTSDAAFNPNGGPVGPNDNHGTWVAGCIAEKINNSLGSAGIAPGAKVASARIGINYSADGSFSAYMSWFVDALYWGQSIGARVSNNSNSFGAVSSAVDSAYASTRANGMVHFASAGNSGASYIEYPASSPSVNAVASVNRFGQRSSFSQYGVGLKFTAPGEEIFTTDRTGATSVSGDYAFVNGTSFASPYAAGVAALIISQNPGFTGTQVEDRMKNTCTDMGPAGYDTGHGYGMLNANRALTKITSSLSPPSVQVGSSFSYQITANNNPTSFSAMGLPPGLQLNSNSGLISGTPTVGGTFQVVVTAHGAADNASATVQVVIIGASITSSLATQTIDAGANFTYQITATNNPTSFDAAGLPPGLQVDVNTGLITGIPNVPGTYPVTLTAHTATGDASGIIYIVIRPPQFTSGVVSTAHAGASYTNQLTVSKPTSSFDAIGLPAGLQINANTGLISGTPTQTGSFQVNLIGHTSFGDATAILYLDVYPPYLIQASSYSIINIGSGYAHQISANIPATYYSAVGLPAGLEIDPVTGAISGIATLSGTYQITVVAHTPYGNATGIVSLTVQSLPNHDVPAAILDVSGEFMLADPIRPRIYAKAWNGIAVIDTETLSIIQTVLVNGPTSVCISPDGTRLWFTRYYSNAIGSVDLDTLTALPDLVTTVHPGQIRAGLGGRLYVTANDFGPWNIFQIDAVTGEVQTQFSPGPHSSSYYIDISPDRNTLFVGASGFGASTSAQYDISTATPAMGANIVLGGNGCWSVVTSHDGASVCFIPFAASAPYSVQERSGADIGTIFGSYAWNFQPSSFAFNADDSLAFQGSELNPVIGVFNTTTFALQRTINLPNTFGVGRIAVDSTNTYLFAAVGGDRIQAYRIKAAASTPTPKTLRNVSTRSFVETGSNVEIGGFIIQGEEPKKVVLRAIGPSLSAYGLPAVNDPVLELRDSTGAVIVTNDNWNSHRQDVLNSGLPPKDEHEAVIVTTLSPGNYTAILKGLNGAVGTALFELYDVDPNHSKVANISTRANVGTGNKVMIGGFIIGGNEATKVIVRAIGPSLVPFGINNALQNPVLELRDASGNMISQNDDWQSDDQQAISDTQLAPRSDFESAIVRTLQPGNYTAIVRGANGTSGIALVEVYNLQ